MEATAIIGVISAATALVASVTGPLATLYVGRVHFHAAVISANRQRWIDALRDLVSEFCAEIALIVQWRDKLFESAKINVSLQPEIIDQFQRLILASSKIGLMINPLEQEHGGLVDANEALLEMIRTAPLDKVVQPDAEAVGRRIIAMTRAIMRQEWLWVQRGA